MIRRSRSRSQQQQQQQHGLSSKLQSSPGRRRVTRSQSRDVDENHISAKQTSSKGRLDSRTTPGQNIALAPVVEESPLAPRTSSSRNASAVVRESPDDAEDGDDTEDIVNISGTTFLPETEADPETELQDDPEEDPEEGPGENPEENPEEDPASDMMVEVLPDLESTGRSVLGFLAPANDGPATIVNKAEVLSNPSNTQSKRLRRSIGKLNRDMEFLGDEVYIDHQRISRQFVSLFAGRPGGLSNWSPDPIVQMANCARFAEQILLAGPSRALQRQALRNIETIFPLPFMSRLVDSKQPREAGDSALEKATFDFALHIRTQSLILQLEDNQNVPNFNSKRAAKLCFYTGLSRSSPPRAFNFPNFSNPDGTLPEQYADSVRIMYDEILLAGDNDSESLDVAEVRDSYPWKRFVLRAARWLRSRTTEINSELKKQMSAKDVHDAFFASKHTSLATTTGGEEAEPLGELEAGDAELEAPSSKSQQKQPESRSLQQDSEQSRSSRPSYLNSSSIQSIVQRRERLRLGNAEITENRRQSHVVQPVSEVIHDFDTNRRQTTSALPSRTQAATPSEPPASFDAGSPTLLPEGPEIILDDGDFGLGIGDEDTQIERSHSPPTVRRSTGPWRQESTSPVQRTGRLSMSQRVWEAAKSGPSKKATPGPSRTAAQRFIDRQQDAARVSPIRDSDSQNTVEKHTSRKRARADTETDVEDDSDSFDHDTRAVDLNGRRAQKPQQSSNKRQRVDEPRGRPAKDIQGRLDEDEDVDEPEPEPTEHRRQTAAIESNYSGETTAGARKRWTEEEDARLWRLLGDHGPKWALILRQNQAQPVPPGEELIERGQVALKDRCRNWKIQYIRRGEPIPGRLRDVTMKKEDIRALEKKGYTVPR
ncbi:hypothetical protein BDV18DRAFT_141261 [Aspergillus unguis]